MRTTVWASDSRSTVGRLLRSDRPDLVHVHNTFPLISPSIYSVCQEERIPVVQSLHNYRLLCPAANFFRDGKPCEECVQHGLLRGVAHACYRNSRVATATVALMLEVHRQKKTWEKMVDLYIALTAFARDKFVEGGLPARKIVVKPNFLSCDPGCGTGAGAYALFVGRSSLEKGLPTLLKAWARLGHPIPLRIIGDSPSQSEMQAMATSQGSADIRFMGRLPREQAIAQIKHARFLVFPSELYETFGLSIIEAFACGVPVIASNLGAMQEIVADGQTGLLFRAGDAQDLAEKVAWAWSHTDFMEELGRNARSVYEANYTAEKNYSALMEIYRQATASRCATNEVSSYCVAEGGLSA
jgi:glycosyltransferase involved in cell wall biosynthesis